MITRKSRAEIEHMRTAGRVVAEVLALLEEHLRPGVSTEELDRLAEEHIRGAGMTPSFKDYIGNARYDPKHAHAYPATLCISIDDEVVHGIPGRRQVLDGQLVSIDVGAIHRGWHADAARTFIVGDGTEDARRLVAATAQALEAGIGAARAGNRVGDIGGAVEDVATAGGFGIVRTFVGHGIGTDMHQDPQVPNFRSPARGVQIQTGMCLAIEPMLTLGGDEVEVLEDGWTVATVDGALAAHFEDTVAVTEDGPVVLTRLGA